MDEVRGGYREAAPPKPERFGLRMGTAARTSLLVTLGTIALSGALYVFTGRVVLLFLVVIGPAIFHLLSGAPRSLEVRHDAIVIHSWLKGPLRLPATELTIHRTDHALSFSTAEGTLSIAAEHFPEDTLERAVAAMRSREMDVRDERLG